MQFYYLIVALHLISIIVWLSSLSFMARIIYLNPTQKKEQEFIYKNFMHPSFYFAIIFGVILISLNNALLSTGIWFYLKLFFLSLLILLHHQCKIYMEQTVNKTISSKLALLPVLFGSFIIILTIIKPF